MVCLAESQDKALTDKRMKREVFESRSEQETLEIAKAVAGKLKNGSIVGLDGELGTGKTVFAKGFAMGLGVHEDITSPTFMIVQTYEEKRVFHHFDVYRIADISEMEEIGYEEYFFSDAICLIEWASLVEELLPRDAIRIWIKKDLSKGVDYRLIEVMTKDAL